MSETSWQSVQSSNVEAVATDDTGALVFTPPPYSNVRCLAYKLTFTLEDQSATGTVNNSDGQ